MAKKEKSLDQKIKSAPKKPGVYIFKDKQGRPLYIGKALNLQSRLSYYKGRKKNRNFKTKKFLKQSQSLTWVRVASELEAILLEINLISQLKPKYNIIWRDDKRPLYVLISKEKFPKVTTGRLPKISQRKPFKGSFYGPFPSGYKLKFILKRLRRIFPFCSCKNPNKPCLFQDLKLCHPSPATIKTEKDRQLYLKQIRLLRLFLRGKISRVVKLLTKEMKNKSREKEYEEAALIRDQLQAIENLLGKRPAISAYLTQTSLEPQLAKIRLLNLKRLLGIGNLKRIEGYDVANLGGEFATASLVVFENGLPNSSLYRRFRVKMPSLANDPGMLAHVVDRRLDHPEWPLPQVILLDGGRGQLNQVKNVLAKRRVTPTLIGLTKKEETLILPFQNAWRNLSLSSDHPALNLVQAVRDEAHRFATSYHKLIRKKGFLDTSSLTDKAKKD